MDIDIKDRLKEEMKVRKIKIPKLSQLLDIPKDRIYAWYRDGTTPKSDDKDKIEKWINEETFTKKTRNEHSLRSIEERLINIEAHNEVFEATLAGLLSSGPLDYANKLAELRKAVKDAVDRNFSELNRKP